MTNKRHVEIFSAGCKFCEDVIQTVRNLACPSCEVEVLDLHQNDVMKKAEQYGISSAPAVAVDGQLLACCQENGVDKDRLVEAGIGQK